MNLTTTFVAWIALAFVQIDAMATPPEATEKHALNLDGILQNVGRDIRELDRDADKEPPVKAQDNDQAKFGKAVDEAKTSDRPKWNEPARIETVSNAETAAGGQRLYRIITPLGSYCLLEKNDTGAGSGRQRWYPCAGWSF